MRTLWLGAGRRVELIKGSKLNSNDTTIWCQVDSRPKNYLRAHRPVYHIQRSPLILLVWSARQRELKLGSAIGNETLKDFMSPPRSVHRKHEDKTFLMTANPLVVRTRNKRCCNKTNRKEGAVISLKFYRFSWLLSCLDECSEIWFSTKNWSKIFKDYYGSFVNECK